MKKKRIFSVLMTVVLTLTLVMFAAPVSAADPPGVGTQLIATGEPGATDTIIIGVQSGTTLGDIASISWDEYLVAGYAPHVDIMLDMSAIAGDGAIDALVVEFAYNHLDATRAHDVEGESVWGCDVGAWYSTFGDADLNEPASVTSVSNAWLTSMNCGAAAGAPGQTYAQVRDGEYLFYSATLADWVDGGYILGIDVDTPVTHLEIEVDNWIMDTEAWVDNIKLNGSGATLLTEIVEDVIQISISETSFDFGALRRGETSEQQPVTITSNSDMDINVSASTESAFYNASLNIGGTLIQSWYCSMGKGFPTPTNCETYLQVVVPGDQPAGIQEGTIIFWAEAQ